MRRIAQDVYLIEGLRICNVYLLVSDTRLTLVDAGVAGAVGRIVAQIEGGGYAPSELESIVVTHAHADHTGGVAELVRRFGAQVIAHREQVPYIEGVENLPTGSGLQRVMRWLSDRLPGEGRGIEVARGLEEGEKLEVLGGLQIRVLCVGHGEPILREANVKMEELLGVVRA